MKNLGRWASAVFLTVCWTCLLSPADARAGRAALVIGNGAYQYIAKLDNPVNDATAMAAILTRLGFQVTTVTDASQQEMEEALAKFTRTVPQSELALVYYAGHGVQADGVNYLVPVNARITRQSEIKYKAVDAGLILDALIEAGSRVNIIILDACRDNPFRNLRGLRIGLAPLAAPKDVQTYIAYATAPNDSAADGVGDHSPFTAALLQTLPTPGLTIEQVFKRVRNLVREATADQKTPQIPWETSSLMGEFYFVEGAAPKPTPAPSQEGKPMPTAKPASTVAVPPQNPLRISFYSDAQADWANDMIAEFNQSQRRINGQPIVVEMYPVLSGTSMRDILTGKITPVIWQPACQPWIDRLNDEWRRTHARNLVASAQSVVLTALVIGMWEPMAQALGYPDKPIGWGDLLALSTNPKGWRAYGHPEWGAFKFGHSHPDFSNSALLSLTSLVYAAAGKIAGLTFADLERPEVITEVRAIEQAIVHYGDNSTWLMEQFAQKGPAYLSALTLYEYTIMEANHKYPHKAFPVVAIYPKEGTFWIDYPFAILDAPWVTAEQRQAAELFRDFLLAEPQQKRLGNYGYRPARPNIPLAPPFDRAHGLIPEMQPTNALELPPPEITKGIQALWHQTKKKATVYLLLDTSGSMRGGAMTEARKGAEMFIKQMEREDQLQVVTFGKNVAPLGRFGSVKDVGELLLKNIRGLSGEGNTRLYDAITLALQEIAQHKAAQPEPRLYGIVVLSDGRDTSSRTSKHALLARLPGNSDAAPESTKIFTIAYGGEADQTTLQEIAFASNGKLYEGTVENIEQVYLSISSYF